MPHKITSVIKYFLRSVLPAEVINLLSKVVQKKSLINGLKWMSFFLRTELDGVENLRRLDRSQQDKLIKNAMFYSFFPGNYPAERILDFLEMAMGKAQKYKKDNLIGVLDVEKLSLKNLIRLYSLSVNLGQFIIAYEIRQLIYDKAIKLKNLDKSLLILEENNDEIPSFDNKNNVRSYFLSLFYKDKNIIDKHLLAQEFKAKHKEYSCFLKGRTVALVGPSKSQSTQNGREIDAFDVVVRFNDTKNIIKNPDVSGLRCDISYFNNVGVNVFLEQNNRNIWPSTLKWAVLYDKSNLNNLIKFFGSIQPATKFRHANLFAADEYLLNGSLNGIQRVIFDLLFFEPKSIKVFNSDLMLNPVRSDGYRSHSDKKVEDDVLKNGILNMASPHDPYTNFQFLKMLYEKGYFDADDTLSNILKGSVYDYMGNLERVYGGGTGY